jgi:hypothetical protein
MDPMMETRSLPTHPSPTYSPVDSYRTSSHPQGFLRDLLVPHTEASGPSTYIHFTHPIGLDFAVRFPPVLLGTAGLLDLKFQPHKGACWELLWVGRPVAN